MYTGNFVSLYLTGLGVGSNATSVVLDGKPLRVTYAGPAPLYDGLDQINVELPPGVTEGSVTVIVGRHASNTVSILVP